MGDGTATRIARITSGGQTGVDRAALDVAIELGLPYGGWCQKGGRAEDLHWPPGVLEEYPELTPTQAQDPLVRTILNVRDSDATLVIWPADVRSAGTQNAVEAAEKLEKPWLRSDHRDEIAGWLQTLPDGLDLNVAGPRESEDDDAYGLAHRLLTDLLAG